MKWFKLLHNCHSNESSRTSSVHQWDLCFRWFSKSAYIKQISIKMGPSRIAEILTRTVTIDGKVIPITGAIYCATLAPSAPIVLCVSYTCNTSFEVEESTKLRQVNIPKTWAMRQKREHFNTKENCILTEHIYNTNKGIESSTYRNRTKRRRGYV